MKKKKLGSIVVIILLLVLFLFYIFSFNVWISSPPPPVMDFTHESISTLRDNFRESNKSFGVYPTSYSLNKGHFLRLGAGIYNSFPDSQPHNFVLKVTSQNDDWVLYDRNINKIYTNTFKFFVIEIRPDEDVTIGSYQFKVFSCFDVMPDECSENSPNLYREPQILTINVI